jgi:hypothetical protein
LRWYTRRWAFRAASSERWRFEKKLERVETCKSAGLGYGAARRNVGRYEGKNTTRRGIAVGK